MGVTGTQGESTGGQGEGVEGLRQGESEDREMEREREAYMAWTRHLGRRET